LIRLEKLKIKLNYSAASSNNVRVPHMTVPNHLEASNLKSKGNGLRIDGEKFRGKLWKSLNAKLFFCLHM
jgi:hypothetical protein